MRASFYQYMGGSDARIEVQIPDGWCLDGLRVPSGDAQPHMLLYVRRSG